MVSQLATGAGDIILNSNSNYAYQNPAGAEGAPLESFPQGGGLFLNDLQGLILHEIGHAIGVDHSDLPEVVMCGWPPRPTATMHRMRSTTARW
jgi:hypothetical protein